MPANYDQPKDVVKRTRFFDGQFLKDQDFIDDQKYHIDRQRRPNRLLRVSGICEGLTVEVKDNKVTVTPGTALDSQGRLIVLNDTVSVNLKDQADALDIFISYGQEESDMTQPGNDLSTTTPPGGASPPSTGQGAAGATRWLERPQIGAVQDRASLKGVSPIWLGQVTVSGSGTNRTVALTTLAEREYTGIYLPSGANPFEAPILRSGGNPNPKLAVLTGDLRIRGTTADNTTAGLNVTNSNPASPSLLYVRNDGNVGIGTTMPTAKLAINGGLHVGGDSDPGDNNLLVDGTLAVMGNSTLIGNVGIGTTAPLAKLAINGGLHVGGDSDPGDNNLLVDGTLAVTGNSTLSGTLAVTGNSTLTGSLTVNNTVSLKGSASTTGLSVDASGDVTMGSTLNFGAAVRQMISLWKSGNVNYGIGIQNGTQYFRTDTNFAWYKGGAHVNDELSPGAIGTTNGTVQMFIKNGNVGIGTPTNTTTPVAKLAINGGLHVGGDSDPGDNNLLVDGTLAVTGNSTLSGTLAVTGDSTLNGKLTVAVNKSVRLELGSDQKLSLGGNGAFEIDAPGVVGGRFKVSNDGKVGIGTSNPTEGKLVVKGSGGTNTLIPAFKYLSSSTNTGSSSQQTRNDIGIYADNAVAGREFWAFSDSRAKVIIGPSDGAHDLETLLEIKVTDYTFKDVVQKGNAAQKKVIAQQVATVFPQSVSQHTDVVPDIYQLASISDDWVTLATDLKPGERVKLITEKGEESIHQVLEVMKDKFRTDLRPEGGKVFVFGREVNDFCTVDYDAIAMLNVSATQQIKKELDSEVRALKAENAALSARLNTLEARGKIDVGGVGYLRKIAPSRSDRPFF
jgi:hypothetical protein